MKLALRLAAALAVFAAFPLLYSNCSELEFGTAEDQTYQAPSGNIPTDEELIGNLPPEEREIIRPISDIIKYPELIPIYSCGPDKIYICHFPSSEGGENTICVALSAVDTHQAHEVQFDSNGNISVLSDYLGPCKPK